MIKQIMNAQSFSDAMKDAGDYRDTFSDEGLKTLFEYLHKQDDILFDSGQICEDWREYSSIESANKRCTGDYEVEAYTLVLHCKSGRVIVKDF
jgi:hypothetical protein